MESVVLGGAMKPCIVLQTDFSLSWGAVAEMKGVIKIVDPELETVDLCHEIKNYDPWEASLSLNTVEPYWPKGTVFVSVVDPGVGTQRRACAAKLKDGSIVITPDNGTLTHLLHAVGIAEVREIDESINRYHAEEDVSVFHGRDIFGYTAARLASGIISFEEVGPAYPVTEIVECKEYGMVPHWDGDAVSCWVMTGNRHYGGILFNVTNEDWMKRGYSFGTRFHVTIQKEDTVYFDETVPFVPSFGYVKKGEPLLYCGSSLYLAMDLNQENLMERYGLDTGREWKVKVVKEDE